jgi:hypothetical protein
MQTLASNSLAGRSLARPLGGGRSEGLPQGDPFVLADIAGRQLWLEHGINQYQDAALTTPAADGQPLGGWADRFGNGVVATQVGAARPTYRAALAPWTRPCVQFDGSGQILTVDALAPFLSGADKPFTIIVYGRINPTTQTRDLFSAANSGTQALHALGSSTSGGGALRQVRVPDAGTSKSGQGGLTNNNVRIYAARFDGTKGDIWLDTTRVAADIDLDVTDVTPNTVSIGGRRTSAGNVALWPGEVSDLAFFDAALTLANVQRVTHYFQTGNNDLIGQIVFDGNSMTAAASSSYPATVMSLLGGTYRSNNVGVSGQTTIEMLADAATQIYPLYVPGIKNILVYWEVTNDLKLGASRADAQARMIQYCQAGKAAGYKVVVVNIIPRDQVGLPATFGDDSQAINAYINSDYLSFSDGIADVAAASASIVRPDGVHPDTNSYNNIIAPIVAAAIQQVSTANGH